MTGTVTKSATEQLDRLDRDWYIDKFVQFIVFAGGISAIVFIIGIFIFVAKEGLGFIFGAFEFTEFFGSPRWKPTSEYNPTYGNGFGTGTRITNGEPLTYLDADESHSIINAYALSFLNMYLRGMDGYAGFLTENHYGDKIIFKR